MRQRVKLKALTIIMVSLLIAAPLSYRTPSLSAALLSSRSVTVADSKPSSTTRHRFNFTLPSILPVGSLEFEYCENNPFVGTSCTPAAGLDVSGAVLSSQTGETGFSIHGSSTANRLVLTRASVATSAIPVSYTFTNAVNPVAASKTVYVRIASFASTDGTGPRVDEGAVVFSTANPVAVQGFVPPYLTFCVGVTVAVNCSSANGSLLSFGALSASETRFLSSEFSGATNDPGGFSTSITGVTMTSGNNTIPALGSAQASQPGVSQFGMNLRANSAPPVGANPSGPGTSTASAPVNSPNLFFFSNNQIVTNSSISTDFRKFTASYIVNVSANQKPGVYSTTLTYIAVAAF